MSGQMAQEASEVETVDVRAVAGRTRRSGAAVASPEPVLQRADDRRWRDRLFYRAFTLPALSVAAGTAVLPLAFLLFWSLVDQRSGEPTLRYYAQSLTSPYFVRTLLTTIVMAAGVTAVSIVLALPIAYVLARHTLLRSVFVPLVSVPRMLPFVVIGYAMVLLLAPYTGVMNKSLIAAGLLSEPVFILFGWSGQAIAFGYAAIVIAIAILTGVFMTVDPQLEDAAVTLGAGRLKAVLTVSMPLAAPGTVAAAALIFSTVVTSYAIPVMLNSRTPYMLSVLIYNNLYSLQERHLAYAQAIIVTALAVSVTAAAQIFLSRFGSRR